MEREDTFFTSWNNAEKHRCHWPLVMGIINITPDSFHHNSRVKNVDEALKLAENHIKAGAHCLDIGAMSTRPGAEEITENEEKTRLLPLLEALVKAFPQAFFSVDTYRAGVAREAIDRGAGMINDITAGEGDARMFDVVGSKAAYCMMHMRGNPRNMQELTQYKSLPGDIIDYFRERITLAEKAGIQHIWVDPGIGFAKTYEQNFALIRELKEFEILGKPILMGISRKGFIYKTLGIEAKDALNGTTALHMACLMNGAKILRVHDVKEAMEVRQLFLGMKGITE